MSAEIRKKLGLDLLVEHDDRDNPIPIVRITKSNDKYLVENIDNPGKNHMFDTKKQLLEDLYYFEELTLNKDAFDDQTGENLFT